MLPRGVRVGEDFVGTGTGVVFGSALHGLSLGFDAQILAGGTDADIAESRRIWALGSRVCGKRFPLDLWEKGDDFWIKG